jgi:hypothetical protein
MQHAEDENFIQNCTRKTSREIYYGTARSAWEVSTKIDLTEVEYNKINLRKACRVFCGYKLYL